MTLPLRIALTGGIASGKSTVAALFAELKIPVIDADAGARAVALPGTPALAEIASQFGSAMLDARGQLDRRQLREHIFADPKQRKILENILHPRVREWMLRRSSQAGGPYQILEIPLLAESGWQRAADRVLVVDCPVDIQVARIVGRDGGSEAQARRIIAQQATREQRLAIADDVIDNSADADALPARVRELHLRYLELAAAHDTNGVS